MNKEFIQLYDYKGRIYIVNIDKISAIDVDRSKVWADEVLLELNQNSIKRLLDMLVGDSE
nr:MAG TPA: hypothetical protein [Caudoviricetes sp.]